MSEPGWYNAEGDPPGTHRYWDGEKWVGDAVAAPGGAAPMGGGAVGAPGAYGAGRGRVAASGGKRIGARIIDVIIIFIPLLIIASAFGTETVSGSSDDGSFSFSSTQTTGVGALLSTLVGFGWAVAWLHLKGATPGKLILGMRVADFDSNETPLSLQQAAMRSANYVLPVLGVLGAGLGGLAGVDRVLACRCPGVGARGQR